MTAALGRSLVLLALLVATIGVVVASATAVKRSAAGWVWTRRLAYLFALSMVAANLLMVRALLARDFSVSYVAQVGSHAVPNWVAFVSLWSSLEGSILFWGLVIGGYVGLATYANRDSHPEYMPWATAVWLACGAFFAFLLSGPAQPFGSVSPVPTDGPGPNPLLQNHLLMVVHPPCLYLGYVGMTIPFGLACAALLTGRLGHDFLRPLRTWLMVPWTFLTCAIVLGGWWAYEVLGWGGYWAWDPVENASFLPWLTATAALHSALLTERKGVLKGWTVTLVLATFLLTILGTFMTRSGVFNSVHSFTQSAIGPTILVFLVLALVWSVALLALRIDRLAPEGALEPALGRDSLFLVNNLVFVLFTFTVLLGTVFPLVVEAARGVQMSVGRPYFDRMAVPLGVVLLLLMGVGPALPWGRATPTQVRQALVPPLVGAALRRGAGLRAGRAQAVDARGAGVRWLHRPGDAARAVAAARAAAARARREPGPGSRRDGPRSRSPPLRLVRRARGRGRADRRDRDQQHDGGEPRGTAEGGREDPGRPLHAHVRRRRPGERAPPGGGGRARRRVARRPRPGRAQPAHEPVRAPARADRHARRAQLPVRGPLPLGHEHRPRAGHARPDGDGEPDGGLDLGRHRPHGARQPGVARALASGPKAVSEAKELARPFNPRVLVLGLAVVAPLVAVLVLNLGRDPHVIGSPLVGRAAPDFTLTPLDGGEAVTLASLRGKPVVLNFWATWCVPCFEEHPVLVSTARRLGDRARFVGVIYEDGEEQVKAFLARQGGAYPSLMDPGSRTAIAFGVFGVPETYFIDAEGKIAAKQIGPLDEQTLAQKLALAGVAP